MAAVVELLNYHRPKIDTWASGEVSGQTDAEYLIVQLDQFGDGRVVINHKLLFADYAGLETEYDAGTATTVLTAAIAAEMSEITWPTDELTSTQRALIGTAYDENA